MDSDQIIEILQRDSNDYVIVSIASLRKLIEQKPLNTSKKPLLVPAQVREFLSRSNRTVSSLAIATSIPQPDISNWLNEKKIFGSRRIEKLRVGLEKLGFKTK